jgi:hypothetical protein
MEIKISVLNTNTVTNETVIKDFVINDGEWDADDIEIPAVEGKEARTMNESYNAFLFLCDGFGEFLNLSENLDFDDDIENIFPIYTASDKQKRKRGYIYDLNEKDGNKTRIILIAPKHYLPSLL